MIPRFFRWPALLLGLGLLVGPAVPAFADDGGGDEGSSSVEKEIKDQMDKILKLMRENEKAILDAARGSGKKPEGVEVAPPPQGEQAGMAEAPPAGTPPPERGEEIRRRMEELEKTTTERGGTIPKELEELVKLIPT